MFNTVRMLIAVSAIAISATSALADREELNSGFHGNTPSQTLVMQRLSPTAAGSHGHASAHQTNRANIYRRGANAYGQAHGGNDRTQKPIKVYQWGKYQGQDPDPNVRLQLRRDVHN